MLQNKAKIEYIIVISWTIRTTYIKYEAISNHKEIVFANKW